MRSDTVGRNRATFDGPPDREAQPLGERIGRSLGTFGRCDVAMLATIRCQHVGPVRVAQFHAAILGSLQRARGAV